jgi:G:T-mismatch repair DNA endonuclease (very short patch repair protein)
LYTGNIPTDAKYVTAGTGENTDCPKWQISAWTVSVRKKTVYEFNGCYWHGHTCQPFRDTPTMAGDTLAERYEKPMARLAKITEAGYQVEVQWVCEFDTGILAAHHEMEAHPIVLQEQLNIRDALYGVELKP